MNYIIPGFCYLLVYLLRKHTLSQAGYDTFLTGEPVLLKCKAPDNISVHGYMFYRNEQEVPNIVESHGNIFHINMVNMDKRGSYTCIYLVLDSRGLWKSRQSPPVFLSVLDQPSTPRILLNPKQQLYFEGESVTLLCDHPHANSQTRYNFYKDGTELLSYIDVIHSKLQFSSLSTKDSGTYSCQYWLLPNQRKVTSSRSKGEEFVVTALSAAPTLNCFPSYSTFILGETVVLECMAPPPIIVTLYRMYKEGKEINDSPNSPSGKLSLHNVTKEDQGTYTCMYWSANSLREIPSTQSRTRELHVIAPLLPPLLSLDPPNGRVWDGGNVTLICTIRTPEESTLYDFHFLNEKQEMSVFANKTETRKTLTIMVWRRNNTSESKYFCQYTANIKGRLILSPKSSHAEITVTTGSVLWIIVVGIVAGIVVLIIMIVLLCWVLTGRKGSSKDDTESKPSSEDADKFTSLRTQDDC
ncbi:immunoglobulin superfamily member 1-like isoform X2 [Pelobates fuscus]|uniref:immunoglobulin superfamily member 1-like isoform X2 n=1 Tax=Pelobates fuscus TaxID=191477 RepID=UPI002FE43433